MGCESSPSRAGNNGIRDSAVSKLHLHCLKTALQGALELQNQDV